MPPDFGELYRAELAEMSPDYRARGIIADDDRIYPLGTDTKVLSTVFEAFTRPIVYRVAEQLGMWVAEPPSQNVYPDFTLSHADSETGRIAVDVKTTYFVDEADRVAFTLGSYTSFIVEAQEGKSILFPFSEYLAHWVVGYVYRRLPFAKAQHHYPHSALQDIPLVFDDISVFIRQKWEIAGDSAGSGNTANIGSRRLRGSDFADAEPLFADEDEFIRYWRGYKRTRAERASAYSSLAEFRALER